MNAPAKHFKPQTRSDQRRILRAINAAEMAMIPAGFDAEAAANNAMHFQSVATPFAHDKDAIERLQAQVRRAESQSQPASTLAGLKLVPLSAHHIPVVRHHQSGRREPLLHQPMRPESSKDSIGKRARQGYADITPRERRVLWLITAVYMAAIVSVVAIIATARTA